MLKHIRSYPDFVSEGVKLGPSGQTLVSKKNDVDDVLRFMKGTAKKTGVGPYLVHYRFDSETGKGLSAETIKSTMDKLKLGNIENKEEAILSFIKPDLLDLAKDIGAHAGYDYIIQVGSSEGLAKIMTDAALKTFPRAKVVVLPKIVHSTYYTAVDYDELRRSLKNGKDSSFKLVHTFIFTQIDKSKTQPEVVQQFKEIKTIDELNSFLESDHTSGLVIWKEGHTDFKVRKSETIPGNIIRFFKKYDFADSEFENAVRECANPVKNKHALIIDDNLHNGTDTTNIFRFIDSVVSESTKNITAMNLAGLLSGSDYYRLASRPYHKHFTAYVLYRMYDRDLPKKVKSS